MTLDLEIFRGRRVFITGHTGFKGSWLANMLVNVGAEVIGYALPPSETNSIFESLELGSRMVSHFGDIRDYDQMAERIRESSPEIIFHLAAQPLVSASYEDPRGTFSTNVMGGANLLEAVRVADSVKALVFITSDKAYENVEWIWGYRENDRLGGRDPYSSSKGAVELVFSSYQRSFFEPREGFGAASARAGNVIGGGDWSMDRIVPDAIRAFSSGKKLQIRNPNSTRPWQHVLEPLSGYLLLAQKLLEAPKKYSGSWNFGPTTSNVRTVAELAQSLAQHFDGAQVALEGTSDFHEANLLQLNCDKAHQLLGWHAKWTADETFDKTANWYKKVLQGASAREITDDQVREFLSSPR